MPTSSLPQQEQQEEQQVNGQQLLQQQNQEASVLIVPGASSLTSDAYQPNPFQTSVDARVTWTNDDSHNPTL